MKQLILLRSMTKQDAKNWKCLYGAYLFNPENTEPCVIRVHRIVSEVKRGQLAVECHMQF